MSNTVKVTLEQPAIEVPFYCTRNSLICTVSRNGHVWGKRLDKQSKKGDIELEIFAPYETACFVRRHQSEIDQSPGLRNRLDVQLYCTPSLASEFTVSQKLTIANIFTQKERIDGQLATIMLTNVRLPLQDIHQKGHHHPILAVPDGARSPIKIIECTNRDREQEEGLYSYGGRFRINYDDEAFAFSLKSFQISEFDWKEGSITCQKGYSFSPQDIQKLDGIHTDVGDGIKTYFWVSLAEGGEFNEDHFPTDAKKYRIQYGEYNFFEYFMIDEALLLLEALVSPAPKPTELYWTLAVAMNRKHRADIIRISSNHWLWPK